MEHSDVRIFDDGEFASLEKSFPGHFKLVPKASWPSVDPSHIVIGLKELPENETFPLKHTHIQFAHCYKKQSNWAEVLSRFSRGGGTLLDLEFLQDATGRRVAAFGYHAGFAGAALAIKCWAWQLEYPEQASRESMPGVKPYGNEDLMVEDVKGAVTEGKKKIGRLPRVLIIGALGRCGKGAIDLCLKCGLGREQLIEWDMAETAKGGPFQEIVESDIFINCIYLSDPIPPFVSPGSLTSPKRNLSVICDVSCDTTNPNNPIPVYTINTSFTEPSVPVPMQVTPETVTSGKPPLPLSVISIDHLPTLLPREASESFSAALLPSLMELKSWKKGEKGNVRVWEQAEALFEEKVATLPKGMAERSPQ